MANSLKEMCQKAFATIGHTEKYDIPLEKIQLYIESLELEIEQLNRKKLLSTYVYPFNSQISGDNITFFYDPSQHKEVGRDQKIPYQIKSISLKSFTRWVKENGHDLRLFDWVCNEGGAGHWDNTPNEFKVRECFKNRLGECLHKMIESDNELKLLLMKKDKDYYHERNR